MVDQCSAQVSLEQKYQKRAKCDSEFKGWASQYVDKLEKSLSHLTGTDLEFYEAMQSARADNESKKELIFSLIRTHGVDAVKTVGTFEVNMKNLINDAGVHSNKIKQMSITADIGCARGLPHGAS